MKEENVQYFENVTGFYVEPADVTDAPKELNGVVMIHEAWGLNENIKNYARKLAGEGYRVLAVDLFGEIYENSPDEAERQKVFAKIHAIDQTRAVENLKSAVEFLRSRGAKKRGSSSTQRLR